jgi:hypothetical protein
MKSHKLQRVCITKLSWLMLFNEIISVYYKNYSKLINKDTVFKTESYILLIRMVKISTIRM